MTAAPVPTQPRPAVAIAGSRIERDALGPLDVPAGALWGIHTARSLEALSFSGRRLGDLPNLAAALGVVKVATARANGRAGVIEARLADAVACAAGDVAANVHPEQLVADPLAGGGAIAVHVNVNEVVANLANRRLGRPLGTGEPVHPKRTVAASQSTADVVHTAGRLALLRRVPALLDVGHRLAGSLEAVATRAAGTPTLSRTCLQDGLAVPAALLFDGAATATTRATDQLEAAVGPLRAVVLGGTVVGTGTGAPASYRRAVVPLLSEVAEETLIPAVDAASRLQHGDDLVAVADALHRLAGVAAKAARDVRLLGSGPAGGFGEVILPTVMEGSSFFAGKANPGVAESVVQAAIEVGGRRHVVEACAAQAELHLHVHDLPAAVALLDAIAVLEVALHRFATHCLDGLAFDEERCRALAANAAALGTPTAGSRDRP